MTTIVAPICEVIINADRPVPPYPHDAVFCGAPAVAWYPSMPAGWSRRSRKRLPPGLMYLCAEHVKPHESTGKLIGLTYVEGAADA